MTTSYIHLTVTAVALIAVGTVLVCAAHIPGLRVLVGAEPTGPVPTEDEAAAEAEMRAMLTALADAVIARHDDDGRAER